ncbi:MULTISPECIES: tyrosine-type recombinase/integrase [unclassified Rudaea]|uniref:tyrosine-type recombinase/integrase n=1 Tax=unclassified Rudaea TaxID=2627037 RepID=UPI002016210F|nr:MULTISPECIES: tyrosine-type recombinase/integrase [unclassified Rudaea]
MATLYQREGQWYLNWRENGERFRRSLGKIEASAAEKIKREKEAQLTLGIQPVGPSPTLADWIDEYCEASTSPKRRQSELKHARAALGRYHIASLPPREIDKFRLSRLKQVKPETVGKEIRILKAALKRAVKLEIIEKSPAQYIEAPRGTADKAVEFYTKAQLAKIYKADKATAQIWRFMANTGIRRGEFAKAVRSDVRGRSIHIESTDEKRTKSGRWREVPLNASAKIALKGLGRESLSPYAADTLTHKFARVAALANVGGNLHILRHTFCSHMVMAGVPLRAVQVLAGHSSSAITERYAHLAPRKKKGAVDKINL